MKPHNRLPSGFLKSHPIDKYGMANIAHTVLDLYDSPAIQETFRKMEQTVLSKIPLPDESEIKQKIESTESAEDIIRLMRTEIPNDLIHAVRDKALSMQEQVMPLILHRFKTSGQDRFIEIAFQIFSKCDDSYLTQLHAEYSQIRSPYAKASACLAFGEQHRKDLVPFLLEQYQNLQDAYPNESYADFPLLALHLIHDA